MQKNFQDFRKDWDFSPFKTWPRALPAFAFNDQLLCGFDREDGEVVVLNADNLLDVCYSIHPELSFIELSRLHQRLPLSAEEIPQLWSLYGYRWREALAETVQRVLSVPREIQNLFQEKKMGPNDLAPLRSLTDTAGLSPYWRPMIQCQASKSELIKILELLVELTLLGKTDLADHHSTTPSTENTMDLSARVWLQKLNRLRYPMSSSSEDACDKKIKEIHWPLRSDARWTRRGDLSGIELKMFFSHPQELKRSLMKLEQINEDLLHSKKFEDLWSRN